MKNLNWKILFAGIWLVFTLSLAGWWMTFTLGLMERLAEVSPQLQAELTKGQLMVRWEGLAWMAALLIGGVTLVYFIVREQVNSRRIREFFGTFSHEIKTSLARIRLQTDALIEDLDEASTPKSAVRLQRDTSRLLLQLENSLFLSQSDAKDMLIEPIKLSAILDHLRYDFPEVDLKLDKDICLMADQRALEAIFKNLIQNAGLHGQATRVELSTSNVDKKYVSLRFHDNGKGFQGELSKVGVAFLRRYPQSGSGLGLYIVTKLTEKLGGQVKIPDQEQGFAIDVVLARCL